MGGGGGVETEDVNLVESGRTHSKNCVRDRVRLCF